MSQYQENATITQVERLSDTNVRLTLYAPQICSSAEPGQFVMIRVGVSRDPLLRRPFCIHQVRDDGMLQVYYKIVGKGTEILSSLKEGEQVSVLGPLGRGFDLTPSGQRILVGGGLGIAPLLFLVQELGKIKPWSDRDFIILGGRDASEVAPLVEDFKKHGIRVVITTDDGSLGMKGFVTDILLQCNFADDSVIYTCGPEAMMKAVHGIAVENGITCQVSVETVMACGMGACLGCSIRAADDTYTHVCMHGPVYNSKRLAW